MYILEVARGCPGEKYPLNGIFELDQAKALTDMGHKVIFAVVDVRSVRKWRKWGTYVSEKDGLTVYNFDFPVGAISSASRAVGRLGFEKLINKIEREQGRPEIVHVHFGEAAEYVVEACRKRAIPYVVTEHSSTVNTLVIEEGLRKRMEYTYSNAARVIAVSGTLRNRIRENMGIDAVVIPNILDFSAFTVGKAPDKSTTGCRFISAGNLVQGKGFDILIKAFQVVAEKSPKAELVIMGGGPEEANLKRQIDEAGLSEHVKMTGAYKRCEFTEKLTESDVFVLASRGETFGLVYAEAMSCGLPVIATRCGGPEDFVNESCGALVPVDDAETLAASMLDVSGRLGEFNSEIISAMAFEKFSGAVIAKSLTEVFEDAIACDNSK